ncbi:MAG: Gfo/Idh/MocA family protein [Phototrophicaceae bacterium]
MTLKVGIVGAGFMGNTHAAAWTQTPANLVGVVATHGAEALATRYGMTVYPTLADLLQAVDVVDICTPTSRHYEQVLQAAAAKKHIVCEKPLARHYAHAQEMVATCKAAGVKLLVAQVVRFFPQYALAKAAVNNGDIGRVATLRLSRASFTPGTPESWLHDHEQSGGVILDLMIHDFDYARWVAGEVESVFARNIAPQLAPAYGDYAQAILRHTNGAISHIEGGWVYPKPLFRTSLEISGDRGLIELPAGTSDPLQLYRNESHDGGLPDIAVPTSPLAEDPYLTQIRHFYSILSGEYIEWRVMPEDGLAAVQIALAAIQSAQTGRRVMLTEVK